MCYLLITLESRKGINFVGVVALDPDRMEKENIKSVISFDFFVWLGSFFSPWIGARRRIKTRKNIYPIGSVNISSPKNATKVLVICSVLQFGERAGDGNLKQ